MSPRLRSPCQDAGVLYDEGLATRVRDLVAGEPGLAEKKMFGGAALLLDGNTAVGAHGDALVARSDPAEQVGVPAEPGVRVFDLT